MASLTPPVHHAQRVRVQAVVMVRYTSHRAARRTNLVAFQHLALHQCFHRIDLTCVDLLHEPHLASTVPSVQPPGYKLRLYAHLTKGTFANDLNRPEVFQTHTGPPQAQKGRLFLAELGEHALLSFLGHGYILVELAFQFNAPDVNTIKHIIQSL